ncbi:MAG: capsular polysaccharide biosynthesis protein CapF [Lachnospiraceae bacterium]|nr:capsular polysaccharide biosynthesis protein CapF [Lachnospiraceae bacterium]
MKTNAKILVTGAKGFIGKNLITELTNRGYRDLYECDTDTTEQELKGYLSDCDFVFHLAGVNRPKEETEFTQGNRNFTETVLNLLKEADNACPILLSSSAQAALDNPYGISKREAEGLVRTYGAKTGAPVYIYRLPGVFGKWCRPNYNSVVATFCHQIARGLPITVNDPERELELVYIDDVVRAFIDTLEGHPVIDGDFCRVAKTHKILLKDLAETIETFRDSREKVLVPDLSTETKKDLYSTYLSYLPEDDFAYSLQMKCDERGSFTEFLKSRTCGQVSVNVAKPGITKGNHWHHSKNEKFLVVRGEACIRFRKIGTSEVLSYNVSGEELTVVDIPTGYVHSITNVGEEDLVTVMWANEVFDTDKPDTFYEAVLPEEERS